jgi:hypothetical protein
LIPEQQENPEAARSDSTETSSLPSDVKSNLPPAKQQTEQSENKGKKFFDYIKDDYKKPMVWIEIIALIVLICYTRYAGQQVNVMNKTLKEIRKQTVFAEQAAKSATDAAETAQRALKLNREQFRQDERPYLTLAPAGSEGRLELVTSGEHAGHLSVELHLANYGKSPSVEIARDARLAIGSTAGKQIKLHKAIDLRGRIIPPADRPSIYAYSDGPVSQQMFNDIVAHKLLLIAYGHIEYTDLLGEPHPIYTSEFCVGIIVSFNDTKEADDDCKQHTRMK